MKAHRLIPVAIVVALILGFQVNGKPVPKLPPAPPAKDDKTQLQGSWLWVSINGAKVPDLKEKVAATVFQDDTMFVTVNGKKTQEANYRLDPTKTPKEIDLLLKQGDKELTLRGIYQLNGDDMKLRYVGPDAKRPVNFDDGTMLLRRIKP